ncbi:MAG: hypothetical protein KDA32_15320 [Phycisphaerales bacterium]|nr:hypothetical protein [Phycisphaerales bacterium]
MNPRRREPNSPTPRRRQSLSHHAFRHLHPLCLIALSAISGCVSLPKNESGPIGLFKGMGDHRYAVTTDSRLAQQYFDQGLTWAFAFNHDEAIRSFTRATEIDPGCAMAWWGIALCNGPHINNPVMSDQASESAWKALQNAERLKTGASEKERRLIDALARRYAAPPVADRAPLDQAYADAMRKVYAAYPDDADIATLTAEAMMDLHPWDMWTQDKRQQPWTPEVLTTLEHALALSPNHPGALHLYIHTCEAGDPWRATAAAERLRNLVPASGHLVHMPSHIDVLTGKWANAAEQNERAIDIDREYRKISPRQGFYRLYMLHNAHMLCFASMMSGRYQEALDAAKATVTTVPAEFVRENAAFADPYMSPVFDVLKRFGKWDAILREPQPPAYLPITTAMWRYTRGLAYAAKHDFPAAERERTAYKQAVANVPEDAMLAINKAHHMLKIAGLILDGEIAFQRGSVDEAVAKLREAVELEDQMIYMEPPEWIQPARHTLGAFLADAKRCKEAEAVYREDLKRWPENAWSLYGLSSCLRARGANDEAAEVEARLKVTTAKADTPIGSSCLCVPEM